MQPLEVFYLVEWLLFIVVGVSLMVKPAWILKLGRRRLPVTEGRLLRVRLSGGVISAVSIVGLALLFGGELA
ncbi:MAG: hypothetical protein K0S70_1441 [Microbacterium sp.]|nr:hypothetical protein [Microbacterium sp.]